MLGIINDLIDISRIESGQIEIRNEIFCIGDVLDELNAFFSPEAKMKKLNFIVNKNKDVHKSSPFRRQKA